MLEIALHKRIEELESENRFLHAENKRLREALGLPLENIVPEKSIIEPIDCSEKEETNEISITGSSTNKYSSPEEKIELFMSLFRGRPDIHLHFRLINAFFLSFLLPLSPKRQKQFKQSYAVYICETLNT